MTHHRKTVSNSDPAIEGAPLQSKSVTKGCEGTLPQQSSAADNTVLVIGTSTEPLENNQELTQSLLGAKDRRTEVQVPAVSPWRMICSLRIEAQDGSLYVGTGWIAGPRLIVTAGHCVYHKNLLGWAKSIEILPGHSEDFSGQSFISKKFETSVEWQNKGDENFDVGAIFLDEAIGDQYGCFSFGVYPDNFFKDRLINISGYPASRYGDVQMHHENRVNSTTYIKIYYDVDTEGGQSGSPIWVYEDSELKSPVVVGIHAYGAGHAFKGNSGVRINSQIKALIDGWRA